MSIELKRVCAGYAGFRLKEISLSIPTGKFTALIGPNGCGKSTLLGAIARSLPLKSGEISIGGLNPATARSNDIAKQVAVLPQSPIAPPSISVEQLIGYGRAPHQNLLGIKSAADIKTVNQALETTGMFGLRNRALSDLSGGQRQRAFIGMCLAQDTPYMLFDEPTSFLDIKHQYETLDLLAEQAHAGRSVVVVLHDIAQAARYADEIVVLCDGAVHSKGSSNDVITSQMISEVYEFAAHVFDDPVRGTKMLAPAS